MTTDGFASDIICVDWGTTSFRAYLVRGGLVVAHTQGARGILTIEQGTHAAVLRGLLAELPCDAAALPIIMSGMIGSRQGWREAPYVAAPASMQEKAEPNPVIGRACFCGCSRAGRNAGDSKLRSWICNREMKQA